MAALGAIAAITASWWALALWPVEPTTPVWLLRTRAVCFGTMLNDLPNTAGWLLLIGQPVGMLTILVAVWPGELRTGFTLMMRRASGQVLLGLIAAAVVVGVTGAAARVAGRESGSFSARPDRDIATALTRVNDQAPALSLVDQFGRQISLDRFLGRPVLVTFAYAHCETVCPLVVSDVLAAQRQLSDQTPAVVVVTLDPWRDTPSRLSAIANSWNMGSGAHVLSGSPEVVERALNAWRVPRVRNEKTGDLSHPPIVYIVGPNGRIAYVVQGNATAIVAAVRAL